jgi:ADP-dependent NAD(P)H-hydrate dehydratase / NAD(P)H-hydrate epimerase
VIVSCDEMKAVEAAAFSAGVSAESLMDDAGFQIAKAVQQFFPMPGRCMVFFGKGHNGGDALVAARHLIANGWNIELLPAFPEAEWSELTQKKYRELLSSKNRPKHETACFYGTHGTRPTIVLDGLLGIGAGGALREPVRTAAVEINRRRCAENAQVFAIDLPTGLNADTGEADANCVRADFTLTIGFPKNGLLADGATNFVGRLAVLPLEKFSAAHAVSDATATVATAASLASLLPRRPFDSHKGEYGRVGIIAGSPGLCGAARMCAEGALRAGAGLVTLYAMRDIQPTLAASTSPEIMVKPFDSHRDLLDANLSAIAIGPGIGHKNTNGAMHLVKRSPLPMVVDADALNMLSANKLLLDAFAGPRLLTPHPGEMNRLFEMKDFSRRQVVEKFTGRFPVTLLLKGARTLVGEKGQPLSYNTTGSPGMATGGMGDVLTGVCVALIAQGLSCYDAARLGAWICGRAAELAIYNGGQSEESLAATDVLENLGAAFKQLRAGGF